MSKPDGATAIKVSSDLTEASFEDALDQVNAQLASLASNERVCHRWYCLKIPIWGSDLRHAFKIIQAQSPNFSLVLEAGFEDEDEWSLSGWGLVDERPSRDGTRQVSAEIWSPGA